MFLFAVEGPIQVLGPIVARDVYDGARTWGLTSAAMGVGQIVGGLLSLRWRPRRPLFVIGAGIGLAAFPVAFLALEVPVGMLYASLAAMGVVWGLYDPFWTTCMQREVAPEMISRVASYDYLGSLAFYPAGLALAGPLADAFGVPAVLWGGAAAALGSPSPWWPCATCARRTRWGRRLSLRLRRPTDEPPQSASPVASHSA